MFRDKGLAQVGQRLRKVREENDLTQAGLGRILGCSQVAVSRYETGERPLGLRHLIRLVNVLDLDPSVILGGKSGRKRRKAKSKKSAR